MESETARVPSAVGRRVLRLRGARGFRKATELAEAAGVPLTVVTELESGVRASTGREYARRIAGVLGVETDALLNPEEDAPPPPPVISFPRAESIAARKRLPRDFLRGVDVALAAFLAEEQEANGHDGRG